MRVLSRLDWLLLTGIAIIAVIARLIPDARTIDDAFITFRYARNIVDGLGFAYNPEIRTLGTTTPLYTLLMAAIGAVVRDGNYPVYALIVNGLADALTCILFVLIIRQITGNRWIGFVGGILWAINAVSVTFAIGGMETSVVILLQVGTAYFGLNRRWTFAGIAAALGLLTRIDSALWVACLLGLAPLLDSTIRPRQLPIRALIRTWIRAGLPIVVIYGAWSLFSLTYFGSAFPNSISAKSVAYIVAPGSALIRLIQSYATPFSEFEAFGSRGALIGFVTYTLLNIVAALYLWGRDRRLVGWIAYPWLYMLAFAAANPLIFRWYNAPPLPALIIGIMVGLYAILARFSPRRVLFNAVTGILAVVWVYSSLSGWTMNPDHGPNRPAPIAAWHRIELIYADIGERLRREYDVTDNTVVGSADIGAVGYFSRAVIFDTVGLVTPELRCYYPFSRELLAEANQNYAIPPGMIVDALPGYLVTPESFVRAGLARDPTFIAAYGDPIFIIPTDFYGTDVRVYRLRIDAPATRRALCQSQ